MSWKIRTIRLKQLGMTYKQYLRSPLWKAARTRYRDSGRPRACAVCGKKRFQLHHVTYRRLGHEPPEDLLPLCKAHHRAVHRAIARKACSLLTSPAWARRKRWRKA